MYINSHTYYSLRYGTVDVETLLKIGESFQFTSLALTDVNNTSAAMHFARIAHRYKIKAVLGVDFRNDVEQQFVALARTNDGFHQINTLLSEHMHRHKPFPRIAPDLPDTFIVYPFSTYQQQELKDNEFIGVKPEDLNRFKVKGKTIPKEKCVALASASFRSQKDFNAHRLLRAIDHNTILSKLEPHQQASKQDLFYDRQQLEQIYEEFPFLLDNALGLLEQCHIQLQLDNPKPKNQETYTGSVIKDQRLMRKLCNDGLKKRYPKVNEKLTSRIEKEIDIITKKGFVSYFLINWDILRYARSKKYFYVGRGSGANSVVAYLLFITDVDPIELDLYFERFINLYRQNPPDFDIDFSWKDRDDIIDYIFKRFPHTCLLATYNTFQYRAVLREIGKVFGLPKHEIDKLSSGRFSSYKLDNLSQLVLKYSSLIKGFPSHLSVHAGGILISEKPIQYYTATFMPPKGFPTTHFDMVIAEDIGLYKFDILSQRGLGKVKDALEVIKQNNPNDTPIDIHDIARFKEDPKVKELLRQGKAIGCFYIESPAMRMLLKKLEVDHYLGLVAASSIIRPGVAKSGMMREYIWRFKEPERRKTAHPVLLDIMPETYGVMVYQEDVIKVAHYFAGLSLADADSLRRGMSGKYRSRAEFQKAQENFFKNCAAKGYETKVSSEIWRQIESFAGYAFSKGHSASYAVESYQALYLKAHYPLEYMVAVLNNGGGFYRSEIYIHEARMRGATVHAPCVNRSQYYTSIHGKDIYLGLGFLKELHQTAAMAILRSRQDSPFEGFDDFLERSNISLEQLTILINIDALRFTGRNSKELLIEAYRKARKTQGDDQQKRLFSAVKQYDIPALENGPVEQAFEQIEILGFPLSDPYKLLSQPIKSHKTQQDLASHLNDTIEITGYLVSIKHAATSKGQSMNFGTFLDLNGAFLDTVHFPGVAQEFPFRGRGVYHIKGLVTEEFDFYSIEVSEMHRIPYIADPRFEVEDLDVTESNS